MSRYDDEYDGPDDDSLGSLLASGDDDALIDAIEGRKRKKKPRRPNLGVVTPGPIKPLGIEAKEVARLATEGPLSQRIAAAFTIGRNDDLAKRVAPEVRRRTAPSLGEAVADVALSQLPSILGPSGDRAADLAAEHAMDRYAEGGGDPGAHATLFGLAGAGGAVGANVGVVPGPGNHARDAMRELADAAVTVGGKENALRRAADAIEELPKTLTGRAARHAAHGSAVMGTLGATGGAAFGTGNERPGLASALEQGKESMLEGALMGAGVTALPEAAAKLPALVREGVDFFRHLELKNRSGSLGEGAKQGDPFSRSRVMGTKVKTPDGQERTIQGDLPVTREAVTPAAMGDENLGRVAAGLAKRLDTHGGFTFDPHTGKFVGKGFAVALGTAGATPLVTDRLTPDAIKGFLADNARFFGANPDVKIGAWKDPASGLIHLEPSEVLPDRRGAVALGLQRGEQAVGDLARYAKGQDGDIPLELQRFEHRSPVAGLEALSGKFQGTNPNVRGAERARPRRTGRVYVQDVGSELEPEFQRQGLHLYHVEVPKGQLYDVSLDPDGIVAKVGGRNVDQWEKAIEKAGYAGYYASEGGYPHYKSLFGETPVVPPEGGRGASLGTARPLPGPAPERTVPTRTTDEVMRLVVKGRKSLAGQGYGAQIKAAVKRGLPDVLDAIKKVPHAAGWYKADVRRMDEVMTEVIPELKDPTTRQLFRAVLAITSSGQNPVGNLKSAIALTNKFLEHGRDLDALSFFNGPTRKIRTERGGFVHQGEVDKSIPSSPRFHGHEDGLLKLRQYLGNDPEQWGQKLEALWAERRPASHRQQATGERVEYTQPLAAEIFGPKIGRYYANLSGVAEDVTVDVWAARTLRRWLGYARTGDEAMGAPTQVEGNVMRAAIAQLAKKATQATGRQFDPMEIQALLWYYEKQRYTELGARDSGQISYADAAELIRNQRAQSAAGHPGLGATDARAATGGGGAPLGGAAPATALEPGRAAADGAGAGVVPGEPAGQPAGGRAGYSAGAGGGFDPARAADAAAASEARGVGYESRGLDLNAARFQNLLDLQRQADDFGALSRLFSGQHERMETAQPQEPAPTPGTARPPRVNNEAARYARPFGMEVSAREFVRGRRAEIRRILESGQVPGVRTVLEPDRAPTPLDAETRARLTDELRRLDAAEAAMRPPSRLKNRGGYLDLSGKQPNEEPEFIEAPAYRAEDGRIFTGAVHVLAHEEARKAGALATGVGRGNGEDGFVTSKGRFVDRIEAGRIAGFGDDYSLDATDGTPAHMLDALDLPASQRSRIESAEVKPNERPVPTGDAAKAELKQHYAAQGGKGNPEVQAQARDYLERSGVQGAPYTPTPKVDPAFGRRVAELYEAARSNPDDPQVRAAYKAFVDETRAQYRHLVDQGVRFEFTEQDPYSNSAEMMLDVARNRRLKVFKTPNEHHPLIAPDENDMFRAVHDYYGHAKDGNEFGPTGEENAYRSHASMFSPEARRAMATETRGQNSWVNFGPYGEQNRANPGQTRFAEQKVFLLPDEVVNAGLDVKPNEPDQAEAARRYLRDIDTALETGVLNGQPVSAGRLQQLSRERAAAQEFLRNHQLEQAARQHIADADRTLDTGLLPNGQPVSAARLGQLQQERASAAEFLNNRGVTPRLKNRPGFLNLGGSKPPELPTRPEGTGTPYKAKVDVSEDERALSNIAKLNLSPEAEAKVRDAYARLDLSKKTVTHEETRAVADELGLDPTRLLGKQGRLAGAELLAVRDVIASNAERIVALSHQAQQPALSVGAKQDLLDEVAKLTAQNDEFLRRYTSQREQAGRDLNALKIIARNSLDAPTWLLQAERVKGLPLTQEEHLEVARLATEKDRDGLVRYVSGLRRTSPQDKLVTLWKAGLLTALGTHEANVLGNTGMAVMESVKDVPAALVDALLSLARGTPRTKAPSVRGLVVEPVKGFVGPGFKAAKRMFRYGAEPEQLAKWDFRKTNFGDSPAGRFAQAYTDAVFNSLGAEDQLFKAAAVGRSLEEQARLLAKGDKALLKQLRKQPTPEMMVQAIADAEVATFQNPNLAHTAVSSLRKGLRAQGKGGETAAAATEFVAPFVKTPSNIVARTIEYSPPGLALSTAKLAKALATGVTAPDQKALAESLGRGVVGSSTLFLLGFMLAREGKATGSAPKDPTERAQWTLEGKIPNGVRMGDTWRSFSRFGPPGMVLAAGAQSYDAFAKSETPSGKIFGALYAPVRAGLDQSFLQGVSGALDALNDPARAGERFVESTAGSVVPSGVAQIARASDPYARETKGVLPAIEARVPGLRTKLPERLDPFGRPIPEGTALSDLFDPTRPTPASTDPLVRALEAADVKLGYPSRTVSGPNHTRRRLSDEEYRDLVKATGKRTELALRELLREGLFSDARETPDDRREVVERTVSRVRAAESKRRRAREIQEARTP